jgi:regulator of CtrA degradation
MNRKYPGICRRRYTCSYKADKSSGLRPKGTMAKELIAHNNAISFAERVASSDVFKSLFKDGMALVEDTANYLDGDGREDAKGLTRAAALAYASESMRLTTRLMQIASWLLLQRAVNEGEMTQAEALSDKKRTCVAWQESPAADSAVALPDALRTLIEQSLRLQERLIHLDTLISDPEPVARTRSLPHPLEGQLSMLRAAFCQ